MANSQVEPDPHPSISIVTSFYRGLNYLPGFFENLTSQTCLPKTELIFVHNAPLQEELRLIEKFRQENKVIIQHMIVDNVETLSASWNRGCLAAQGEFVTIWNVDDRRTPFSLENQVAQLTDQSAWMAYGDYIETHQYGSTQGQKITTPPFSFHAFTRGFPSGGAFMLFRKDILNKVGPFDEQFRCCADFEYVIRLTLNRLPIVKTAGLLGYFTNASSGLSTQKGEDLRRMEDTVVQLRYGIFDKVRSEYINGARQYQIDRLKYKDDWLPIALYCPNLDKYLKSKSYLRWIGYPRNRIRRWMSYFGIWDWAVKQKLRLSGRVKETPSK